MRLLKKGIFERKMFGISLKIETGKDEFDLFRFVSLIKRDFVKCHPLVHIIKN